MLIRLSKNTFVRILGKNGYIVNQNTRFDRLYNETGADFLRVIGRTSISLESAIEKLHSLFGDSVSTDELTMDFCGFVDDLANYRFIVKGETEAELDEKDIPFSYKMGKPRSFIDSSEGFISGSLSPENTEQALLTIARDDPRLNCLQFELTSRCNERCIHCYIPNEQKNDGFDMPVEKVYSIIDEFADMGGLAINLSGGEVFLHKDLIPIIKYARKKDMQVNILSNLIALRDSQIADLKEANISFLQTSLYSMNPNIHDTITTIKGSHRKTVAAIKKLVAADIPIQISCPVMKANKDSYPDVLAFAQEINCKARTDFIMMAQSNLGTDNLTNRISLEETEKLIKDIVRTDPDYRNHILTTKLISSKIKENPELFKPLNMCGAGFNMCCIAENGDVYPCPGWQGMTVGNVYKDSLNNIWENSIQLKRLRKVTQGDFYQCLICDARDYCAPCLVRNFNENGGDMFKVTKHFCDVAFLTKRIVEEYKQSVLTEG